jgi:hypothetical protein
MVSPTDYFRLGSVKLTIPLAVIDQALDIADAAVVP